jgi:hypothetical protein
MHNDNLPGLTPLWLIVLAAILVFMLPTGVAFIYGSEPVKPSDWIGFAGSLLAALIALAAAYKTLKPMRDQLTQLVRQNDHNLYDGLRRRSAELNVERHAIEQRHATSGVVEIAMRASQPNPDSKALSRLEKVMEEFQAKVDSIRNMRATVWGSLEVQSDRNAFVDLCFGMSDDFGALFFEMKTAKKIIPDVLAKHVQAWQQSRQLLVGLRNKMHGHVEGELDRIGHVVSELEERLFTK